MSNDLDNYDCENPDCVDCRMRRGERPMPSLMAEFEVAAAQVQRAAAEDQAGRPQDRPVTIYTSETCLIALAFLDRLAQARLRGGLHLVGQPIDTNDPAVVEGALRYLSAMLVDRLDMEFEACREGRHPLLFAPERRRAPDGSTIH